MKRLQVVGHRGARGLAPENTVDSVRKAEALGVDYIEIDVRYTSDRQLILHHDRSLYFSCRVNKMVDQLALKQIKELAYKANFSLATLQEALDAIKSTPVIIEIKEDGTADLLFKLMAKPQNKRHKWLVTSRRHDELLRLQELDGRIKTIWAADLIHPIRNIRQAKKAKAYGVSLNFWAMNFLDYRAARRAGLVVMVFIFKPAFVLSSPKIIKLMKLIYPDLLVCTDRPDMIVPVVKG